MGKWKMIYQIWSTCAVHLFPTTVRPWNATSLPRNGSARQTIEGPLFGFKVASELSSTRSMNHRWITLQTNAKQVHRGVYLWQFSRMGCADWTTGLGLNIHIPIILASSCPMESASATNWRTGPTSWSSMDSNGGKQWIVQAIPTYPVRSQVS